jgi:hypothetical protein
MASAKRLRSRPALTAVARFVRVITVVGLCTSPILSACRNQDLAAAPSRGEVTRVTRGGHSPARDWSGDAAVFGESEAATAATPVPDRGLLGEWAAQHTPVEATVRMMLRPRSSALAPAITCDPRSVKPARAAESVEPAFLIGADPTRCVVNPDSIAAQDPLLQIP